MLSWWRRLRRRPALSGAPAAPREKTYAARSGYVYHYTYRGHRAGEYVFEASADRRHFQSVSVVLEEEAVAAWQQERGRELSAAERYGAVKMALFQAFDERARPALMDQQVRIRAADLAALLETLGIE